MFVPEIQQITFESGANMKYFFATTEAFESGDLSADEREQVLQDALQAKQDIVRKEFPVGALRFAEFFLSRFLLVKLIKDFKQRNLGGVSASLAHTHGGALVGAQGTLAHEDVLFADGVGVDLERTTRKISEATFKRVVKNDLEKSMPSLLLWTLKESSFKAHAKNEKLLLSDFFVMSKSSDAAILQCSKTSLHFEAKWLTSQDFLLTFARKI